MAERRFDRMLRQVRRWRSADGSDRLHLGPSLPDGDLRQLRRVIDDCIAGRGGELAARRRATAIGSALLDLDQAGRRRFFELLAEDYDHDDDAVDHAIAAVVRAGDADSRRRAERELSETLQPRRQRLLRRFVGIEGGLPFLIDLREELLPIRRQSAALTALDEDLRRILAAWFDVALLKLEQLDWSSPAATLEKLIEYEAVHAIESWDDLRGRLGPGRRCYAYFHPSMPGEPLIFVEVALTSGISRDLPTLLDHGATRISAEEADTAIFYSISNCHDGLTGVSLGDLLIKGVVEELQSSLPNLTKFSTLSPIPGFRQWLEEHLDDNDLLQEQEMTSISPATPESAAAALRAVVTAPTTPPAAALEPFKPALMRLATRYLTVEKRGQRAVDPVANFHLSNGSRVERVNWLANPGKSGWERGVGMMVNYRYILDTIESNHDEYTTEGIVKVSGEVEKLQG